MRIKQNSHNSLSTEREGWIPLFRADVIHWTFVFFAFSLGGRNARNIIDRLRLDNLTGGHRFQF